MIQTKFYEARPDGVNLYRTYSDAGLKIKCDQTEAVYDEAIDIENSGYTYSETEERIERVEMGAEQYYGQPIYHRVKGTFPEPAPEPEPEEEL